MRLELKTAIVAAACGEVDRSIASALLSLLPEYCNCLLSACRVSVSISRASIRVGCPSSQYARIVASRPEILKAACALRMSLSVYQLADIVYSEG